MSYNGRIYWDTWDFVQDAWDLIGFMTGMLGIKKIYGVDSNRCLGLIGITLIHL